MKKLFLFTLLTIICFMNFSYGQDAFCNPKVLAAQTFYEDTLTLALYTHKPVVPGHCLIIPKRHVERFENLTDAEILQIGQTLKKVDRAVKRIFGTSDYFILEKNGKAAYQSVPHVHFHYVPKKAGDTSIIPLVFSSIMAQIKGPISSKEMTKVVKELSEAMILEN
jgi:histidine triad (HIT) family protein